MSMPKQIEMNLPVLKELADNKPHNISDIISSLAIHFQLTEEELKEKYKSGSLIFDNRIYFSILDLKFAKWIKYTERKTVQITEEGKKIIAMKPDDINLPFLREHSAEYAEYLQKSQKKIKKSNKKISTKAEEINLEVNTEEALDNVHTRIDNKLEFELLNKARELDPTTFERLIIKLIARMGYAGGDESEIELKSQHLGGPGDQGLDGVVKQDMLGLDRVYLQAKRYQEDKGIARNSIDEFSGSLSRQGANKGVFITTSYFTPEAKRAAEGSRQQVILIDGDELARLMRVYNIGCEIVKGYEVKKLDEGFFDEI